jgi:hypothetical protein
LLDDVGCSTRIVCHFRQSRDYCVFFTAEYTPCRCHSVS